MKIAKEIFRLLCSLKLAVLIILGLAGALAAGTIIESLHDTPTSQYWVYRSLWFHLLLASLGINIFCVALSRYPWKRRHIPFLLAHLGILILLAGSWLTEKVGIDGNIRISEGETASVVELDTSALFVSDTSRVFSVPIRWLPPGVPFEPIQLSTLKIPYDLKVDQYLSHADSSVSFVSKEKSNAGDHPAAHLRIVGGPMQISQDFWLWDGAPGWQSTQMGPARFALGKDGTQPGDKKSSQPRFSLYSTKDGGLIYESWSSGGKKTTGKIPRAKIQGFVIDPGWKGNVKVIVEEWISNANPLTTYKPARIQSGPQAPSSAIHVVASPTADVWLGLGDRAVLHVDGQEVQITYYPKRIVLPFSIRLDRFTVDRDPGTVNPAAYSSRVTVLEEKGQKEVTISMNEPLELKNYTIYQASYEDGDPRPVTSVFSVNRDPGRIWKYLGSFLIVLGSVLLFAAKYRRAHKAKQTVSPLARAGASLSEVL